MEPIRVQRTASAPRGAMPTLHTVQTREFGASALFYAVAQELGLLELINAYVPPAPPGRRTSLSVGHDLLLAALNRATWPTSKRAFAEWDQSTVLARVVPAAAEELSRQRFWDHLDVFEAAHFAPLQEALLARMRERFPLGERLLVSDTTNDYPCIPPFTRRPSLPPRGRNQQKRAALRQRSLALVVDEEQGLPLSSRGYEGNTPDVVALGASLEGMLGPCCPQHASPRLTLVLDQGNVSRDNFTALSKAQFSFLAAIPAGWGRQHSQGSLKAYQPLALSDGRRVNVSAQPQARLLGIAGKLLGSLSPRFSRRQVRTLALLQRKADQTLRPLQTTIQAAVARHRPRTAQAVRRAMDQALRQDRLQDVCSPTLHLPHGAVEALSWEGERRKKRAIKHGTFGRPVLLTDRRELSDQRMVVAYRSQAKVEERFRLRKSRRPGVWWPAYHWTESKRSVHALYGFLALLLMRIVVLRLQERHVVLGVDFLLERLRGMQEALVVYANGAAQRVLTQRSPEQEELFVALT